MRNLVIILILILSLSVFGQNENEGKWQSQVFIDLNAGINSSYEYYDFENRPREASTNGKGSLELAYNIDYNIFKKLSAVGIVSLTNYNDPSFASLKTGLGLKLLYVDHRYHYLTLQYGYHIPFDRSDFREGHQIKIGQVFDIANIFNKRLLLGLYYNYDFFYLEGSEPFFNNASRSYSLSVTSLGISLGLKF